jgi:hypothetical protein
MGKLCMHGREPTSPGPPYVLTAVMANARMQPC